MNVDRYYSVSKYYKKIFSAKVYKITVDAGCTCPNRDGSKGVGGCIFCNNTGSGDFAASKEMSISEQVKNAKLLVKNKLQKNETSIKYVVYFQNFTNTYGDETLLVKKYIEAAKCQDVVGVIIGTRPDCISDFILTKIAELEKKCYVSIELGLQSSKEQTIEYIRRCYKNEEYINAIKRIKKASPNIHIVTHIIFGLPNENYTDMLNTVKFAVNNGTDGLKIALLHVLRGTDLAIDYENKKFSCMTMEEYFKVIADALKIIPKNIVIHRLTGDGAKKNLIAPKWTEAKHNVLNQMKKYFKTIDLYQGSTLD